MKSLDNGRSSNIKRDTVIKLLMCGSVVTIVAVVTISWLSSALAETIGTQLSSKSASQPPVRLAQATTTRSSMVATGRSPTCGQMSGQDQKDLDNVKWVCEKVFLEDGVAESVSGDGPTLVIRVTEIAAKFMDADTLWTEQLMHDLMAIWKKLSESSRVTVRIEWRDVEIVIGRTTLFGADRITFRE